MKNDVKIAENVKELQAVSKKMPIQGRWSFGLRGGFDYWMNVQKSGFDSVGQVTVWGMVWKDVTTTMRSLVKARQEKQDQKLVTSLAHTLYMYELWILKYLGDAWKQGDSKLAFKTPLLKYQPEGAPVSAALCAEAVEKGIKRAHICFFRAVSEKSLVNWNREFDKDEKLSLNNFYHFARLMERATRYEQEGSIDVMKTFDAPTIFLKKELLLKVKLNSRNAQRKFGFDFKWEENQLTAETSTPESSWATSPFTGSRYLASNDYLQRIRAAMLQKAAAVFRDTDKGIFSKEQKVPGALATECRAMAQNQGGVSYVPICEHFIEMFQTLTAARNQDTARALETATTSQDIASVKRGVGARYKKRFNAMSNEIRAYFKSEGVNAVDMVKIVLGTILIRQQKDSSRPSNFASIVLGEEFFLFLCDYYGKTEIQAKERLEMVKGFEDGEEAEFVSGTAVAEGKVAFVAKRESMPDGKYVIRKDAESDKWYATVDAVEAVKARIPEVKDDTLVVKTTGAVKGKRNISKLADKISCAKKVTLWCYDRSFNRKDVHNALIIDGEIVTTFTTVMAGGKPDPRQTDLYDFKEGVPQMVRPISYKAKSGADMEALFIVLKDVKSVEYNEEAAMKAAEKAAAKAKDEVAAEKAVKNAIFRAQNATMLNRKIVNVDELAPKTNVKAAGPQVGFAAQVLRYRNEGKAAAPKAAAAPVKKNSDDNVAFLESVFGKQQVSLQGWDDEKPVKAAKAVKPSKPADSKAAAMSILSGSIRPGQSLGGALKDF